MGTQSEAAPGEPALPSSEAALEKEAAMKARRKASKLAKCAAAGLEDGRSPRFGARNENRAAVFVKWLVDRFGVERLREEGVCDVAGGGAGIR